MNQVIHDESKLGWHKAKSAAESCRKYYNLILTYVTFLPEILFDFRLNSSIKIDVYLDGVSPSNAIELVSKYEFRIFNELEEFTCPGFSCN